MPFRALRLLLLPLAAASAAAHADLFETYQYSLGASSSLSVITDVSAAGAPVTNAFYTTASSVFSFFTGTPSGQPYSIAAVPPFAFAATAPASVPADMLGLWASAALSYDPVSMSGVFSFDGPSGAAPVTATVTALATSISGTLPAPEPDSWMLVILGVASALALARVKGRRVVQ